MKDQFRNWYYSKSMLHAMVHVEVESGETIDLSDVASESFAFHVRKLRNQRPKPILTLGTHVLVLRMTLDDSTGEAEDSPNKWCFSISLPNGDLGPDFASVFWIELRLDAALDKRTQVEVSEGMISSAFIKEDCEQYLFLMLRRSGSCFERVGFMSIWRDQNVRYPKGRYDVADLVKKGERKCLRII